MIEGVLVLLGLLAIGGLAYLPHRVTHFLGVAFLIGLVFLVSRGFLGSVPGGLAALACGAIAFRFAPVNVLRRLAFMVPSLLLLIAVTTWLMYMAPGNPFAQEKTIAPQVEEALRAQYGVPESPLEFFQVYMKRILTEGSLGPSLKVKGRTVQELLLPALPISLALGGLAMMIAIVLGLALGVRAGTRPNSTADHASMGLALIGISLPNFVIGALLMIVFALQLGWLPVAGWGGFRHVWMPALTLALPHAATIARLARSGTIEVMQEDWIRTARAKGLPEHRVVSRHALRVAVLPVVSYLGPAAAGILTGSFVVETLFGIPGMGQWFVKGAINRDYSVVLGTALFYCTFITFFNLLVDLAMAWLDPRTQEAS